MRKTILYKKGYFNLVFILAMVFIITLSIDFFKDGKWFVLIPFGFAFFLNLHFLLSTPQSVFLVKDKITEKHLFQEKSFMASEVESININRRVLDMGRGARAYNFVDVQTTSGYVISIEYFPSKTPDIYEILQGWHKKHLSKIRQKNQQN